MGLGEEGSWVGGSGINIDIIKFRGVVWGSGVEVIEGVWIWMQRK